MNFRRTMLLLLVFLLLLLPTVWFTAPQWLSKAAEYFLAQQQCSAVVVDIKMVGWNKSHINRLYCKDQKDAFEADITDVDIGYSLAGLMDKRIGHVKVESIALHLHASSEAKAEAIPLLTTPALVLEALPLASFDIRNIYVQRQDSKGEVLQELRGFATYSDQGLSLALNEDTHLKGLQLKLLMDKNNGVRAALSQGKISILNIELTLHKTDGLLSVDGIADIALAPLSTVLKPWLNMPGQQLEGKLHGLWQVALPTSGNQPLLQQLKASTALKLDFALNRPDSVPSRGRVNLNLTFRQGLGLWNITERSQVHLADKQKTMIDLSGLSGSFSPSASSWKIAIARKSELKVKNISMDDVFMPQVTIGLGSPVEVGVDKLAGIKVLKKASLIVSLPALQWQGNSLASQKFYLSIHRGSIFSPSGNFRASGITFTSPTLLLPKSNISGTFALSAKQVTVTGNLDTQEGGVHLNWTLKHQLARQKGGLVFSSKPLVFGAGGIDLSRIIKSQGGYAIDHGTLNLNGRLRWQNGEQKQKAKLGAQFHLKLSNLKGHYNANLFSGLSGNLHLIADEHKLLMTPALVTLESFQAGVPVNNISMRAAFTYPFAGLASMEVNQLTAEALGGRISSNNISINLARASNPFVVKLEHLDAAEAVKIRQQEGLHVNGLLDGTLPFDWSSDGLKMTSGKLKSTQAGGLIRYLGTESVRKLAATDKATKMVLDIMNNFHYDQLTLGTDYRPDGELKMSIHLKGYNPEYEQGRSIVFNFNIEENLLKLLQGLGMTGNISDALEQRVQKKLQQE